MSAGRAHRFRVTGMDCANDAREIEESVRSTGGVADVKASLATQILTIGIEDSERLSAVVGAVTALGYQLNDLDGQPGADAEDAAGKLSRGPDRVSPAYKRALWIVVTLNVGYGLAELIGGILADSQALRADALDFLGDGLITFVGLTAIGWSLRWRARSALIQGLFLGALGISVLATTAYQLVVRKQPEAAVMGTLGVIALIVNVAAARVLLPHRTGDSNARAVWLFSRNDAIGNAAVVFAAVLVAWTDTPWPDLAVAVIIAGLFLHSAGTIVRDAISELKS